MTQLRFFERRAEADRNATVHMFDEREEPERAGDAEGKIDGAATTLGIGKACPKRKAE